VARATLAPPGWPEEILAWLNEAPPATADAVRQSLRHWLPEYGGAPAEPPAAVEPHA